MFKKKKGKSRILLNKSGCKETNAKAHGDKSNYNHLSDESKNVCILTDMKTIGIQPNGRV